MSSRRGPIAGLRTLRDTLRVIDSLVRLPRVGVLVLGAASAVAGLLEALLMVVLVRAALAIGGDADGSLKLPVPGMPELSVASLLAIGATLAVATAVLHLANDWFVARTMSLATVTLRRGIVADFLNSSWALQSREREGEFLTLMAQNTVQSVELVTQLAAGYSGAIMVVALLVGALVIEPLGALASIVAGGLLMLLLRPLATRARAVGREAAHTNHAFAQTMLEVAANVQDVKVSNAEASVLAHVDTFILRLERPYFMSRLLRRLVPRLYQSAVIVLVLAGLAILHVLGDQRLTSIGAVVLILIRILMYGQPVQQAAHALQEGFPFVEELRDRRAGYRANQLPWGDHQLGSIDELELRDVAYGYDGGGLALQGVSLRIPKGEMLGVIGPSGSGKTTLSQLLLRLRLPTSGTYLVNGVPAAELAADSWLQRVGFVPQEPRLFTGTVAQNITLFDDTVPRDAIEQAARDAFLHEEILGLPEGYDTMIANRGERGMSGGQRQRLCIARALVRQPDLLVLDEPTSALDVHSEDAIKALLEHLMGERTLVVIAHRVSTLQLCDRILVMDGGLVVGLDHPSRLAGSNRFYEASLRTTAGPG